MAHVFHQLYYHFIWSTHNRDPHLDRSFRKDFLRILTEETIERGGKAIRRNAMPDHVHLLVRLPPTISVSTFVGQLKGATAHRVNQELKPKFELRWQSGYGVLTLRKGELAKVMKYIDNQEDHHRGRRLSEVLERIDVEEDDWAYDEG